MLTVTPALLTLLRDKHHPSGRGSVTRHASSGYVFGRVYDPNLCAA
jgi:hypothetical protein